MIRYTTGDIMQSDAQVLANPVNTVGVMGKGLAKAFKDAYPAMFREHRARRERGELDIGTLWLYKSPGRWVLNFPTKRHWRQPSKAEYIEAGLEAFVQQYAAWGIESIAFPALGSGLGQLDFEADVRPLLEGYLADLPIDMIVYLPHE